MKTLDEIRRIFCEAIEKQAKEQRDAYLDEVCRDNPSLRAEVDTLLEAHYGQDDLLNGPIIGSAALLPDSPVSESHGAVIDKYKLLEKIGEGGMAVVYMAEQREPIRRKVALKIIKLGMDTKSVIARFEAERQALAMMDHPNIAKVLDAGATDTGRPYFVMELVKGTSITEFCDVNNLSTHERLELFICVCQAVQHAHQKGIIHRDIKPSNILVTLHDGRPVPKVIDFGIAKAVNRQLTEKTFFTRYAQIIGTPAYMSPEQAEMSGLDIDIRTDVFSLGTLLYELLTGSTPFDTKYLLGKSYEQMQRTIREEEPMRPSTKISTLGEALIEVAKRRRTSPDALRKLVRADLDWVVMKTLEKDRDRRYDTVSEFAADIRRYLKREPVLAGPPSVTYRIKKFIKRHSVSVAVSTAIAATIILGLVISTSLYLRMRRALNTVHQLETKADIDSKLSTAQRLHADGRHQAALNELEAVFEKQAPEPEAQLLRAQLVAEVGRLEDAETQLLLLTKTGPEVAGAAYSLLARLSIGVDETKANEYRMRAESIFPETADAYSLRAMASPDPQEALQWLNLAISLDPSHYSSRKIRALTYYRLGDDERMGKDVEAMVALRPADSLGYVLRAILHRKSGRFEEALADQTQAIALCQSRTGLPDLYQQRYETHTQMGNYELALQDAQHSAKLEPDEFRHLSYIFRIQLALNDFGAAQKQCRSIVQRNHQGRIDFTRFIGSYVFDILGEGQTLAIPTETISRAPFAQMQRAADCYHALTSVATPYEMQRQGMVPYAWSPDGRKLLCGWLWTYGGWGEAIRRNFPASPQAPGLKIIDIETGEEHHVAYSHNGIPCWSPDGKTIAYPDRDGSIYVVPADGGQARRVVSGNWPQWAKDSQHLYYNTNWGWGDVCCINTHDPDPIPKTLMRCTGNFIICEEENWIASGNATTIRIVDLSSGSALYECSYPWPQIGWHLSLSSDNRELCFKPWSYMNNEACIVDIQDKKLYSILDHPADRFVWSPDGSRLAIGARRDLWIMELDPNRPVSQVLGKMIPDNDLIGHKIERLAQAIAADPSYPENYLERALACMALNQYDKARSDLEQFDGLVTSDDHHAIYEIFDWLSRYDSSKRYEEADFLTPYAEKLMDRFAGEVPSYRDLINGIIERNERRGRIESAGRWRAKLQKTGDRS